MLTEGSNKVPAKSVLVVEDSKESSERIVKSLENIKDFNFVVDETSSTLEGVELISKTTKKYAFAFVDINIYSSQPTDENDLSPFNQSAGGWLLIALLKQYHPACKIIVISSVTGVDVNAKSLFLYDAHNHVSDRNSISNEAHLRHLINRKHCTYPIENLRGFKKQAGIIEGRDAEIILNGDNSEKIDFQDISYLEILSLRRSMISGSSQNFPFHKLLKQRSEEKLADISYFQRRTSVVKDKIKESSLISESVKRKIIPSGDARDITKANIDEMFAEFITSCDVDQLLSILTKTQLVAFENGFDIHPDTYIWLDVVDEGYLGRKGDRTEELKQKTKTQYNPKGIGPGSLKKYLNALYEDLFGQENPYRPKGNDSYKRKAIEIRTALKAIAWS